MYRRRDRGNVILVVLLVLVVVALAAMYFVKLKRQRERAVEARMQAEAAARAAAEQASRTMLAERPQPAETSPPVTESGAPQEGGRSERSKPQGVVLVDQGKARATIYSSLPAQVPRDEYIRDRSRTRLRASIRDLALYLGKMSGATIEVVHGRPPAGTDTLPVLIGGLGEERFGPPEIKSSHKQAFRVVVSEDAIACIGDGEEATGYAIYEILDRLGCRWYMPSEMGEVIPRLETIALPKMDSSKEPFTIHRAHGWADENYRRRNRLGGVRYTAQYGKLEQWITREQRAANPDWGAQINGKRVPRGHLCWSSSDAAKAIAENIIRKMDEESEFCVSLSPMAGMTVCGCERCKALDPGDWDPAMGCVSVTDRYVHFCNQIAEQVTKKHPELRFGIVACYQRTRPPVREKLHPNIIPQIEPVLYCRAHSMVHPNCPSRQSLSRIVEGWGKLAKVMSAYWYAHHVAEPSCPYPMIARWREELPMLYASGVRVWCPETLSSFEATLPGLYLGVRLSWYTKADPEKILGEFFTRFYGAAAEPMERYWRTVDDAWTNTADHAGCRFGHPARFTPAVMERARKALDEALVASKTAMELRRVRLVDDSFREFELYMKMLRDFADGRWANLGKDQNRWTLIWDSLTAQYKEQHCFFHYGSYYFGFFNAPLYVDAARVAKECKILTKPVRKWRFEVDREPDGEEQGWHQVGFDDTAWRTVDPCVQTWSALGLFDYFGVTWYRAKVKVLRVPEGKKVCLWLGGTEGRTKLFVNGQHVPYLNDKGETVEEYRGYCKRVSFDITSVAKPGAENLFALKCTRRTINEIGTGGLLGPVVIYREK